MLSKLIPAAAALFASLSLTACPAVAQTPAVRQGWVQVDGLSIFYREAGPRDAPVILLLHGFPASSFMYRDLIPRLAGRFRVIAPDYPGAGFSDAPPAAGYDYSFDNLAAVMARFAQAVGADRYALYMQDFGGPVGFRIATWHPDRVTALIIQNANAYEEGLSAGMLEVKPHWGSGTAESEALLRSFLSPQGIRDQIVAGAADAKAISPDSWTHAQAVLAEPARRDAQFEMLDDYASNLALYPRWQAYLRDHRPPMLVVWGRGDPLFIEAGAHAYRRDHPGATLRMLEAGHFAVEEQPDLIAREILAFMADQRLD